MKITKSDIDFNAIEDAIDALDDTDCVTALFLSAFLIQGVAQDDNSPVEVQLENVKKILDSLKAPGA